MTLHEIVRHARVVGRIARTGVRHTRQEWSLHLEGADRGPEAVLLVLGCQRSGTTQMTRMLGRDPDVKVYPEHSPLTLWDLDEHLRLAPIPRVADRIASSHFPLVVLKPLVESQNAIALLDGLPNAHAIWMFRHWADVARSNLARFGRDNGVRNLRRVVERRADDWRAQSVAEGARETVAAHFSEAMNPFDAAALFWWVRNTHFFALGLDTRPRVLTCRYEELVTAPVPTMESIYRLVDRPFPGEGILRDVSGASVGLGSGIEFSAPVADLCDQMLGRLVAVHERAAACA